MRSPVADPPAFDRHRRLRRGAALRSLVREHRIDPRSLVLPVFVDARITAPEPIASMPGHVGWPAREAARVAERAAAAGIGGLLLFGLPDMKDEEGSGARDPLGPVPDALRRIRASGAELALIADV
ncbi:MAG: porphobilinogen synthase, partial [Chloroflexota bacterium]|nr:porphobilinogen synthase [Chloroflexota bacterium]